MAKVLKLINACSECPNRQYDSGGAHDCSLVKERIPEGVSIAPFCPLTEYPARVIADQAATIRALTPQGIPFSVKVLALVATMHGLSLRSHYRGIVFELEDGGSVFLAHDSFEVDSSTSWIKFNDRGKKYRLYAGERPQLMMEITREGQSEPSWTELTLKNN